MGAPKVWNNKVVQNLHFQEGCLFRTLNVFPHVVVPIVGLENPTEFHRKYVFSPACRVGELDFFTTVTLCSSPSHRSCHHQFTWTDLLVQYNRATKNVQVNIPLASLNRLVSKVVDADEKCSSSAAAQRSAVFEFASEVAGDITEAWWKLVVVKGLQSCWRCDCYDGD